MRHNSAADFFGVSACFQNLGAFVGVVVGARILLVIEIMEKTDRAPQFFVAASFTGVGAHASLDCECVFSEAF